MKKSLTIVTLASTMLLAGCSSNNSSSSSQSSTTATSSQQASSSSSSQVDTSKTSFTNGKAVLDNVDIQITDHKVIQKGEKGNEYGSKPVIAFWYKVTNKNGAEVNAMMAWMVAFNAYQDNDPNKENKLNVGMLPDDRFTDSQTANIKNGGTVENAVAYELTDTTTPVKLVATKGFLGNKLGEETFEIK